MPGTSQPRPRPSPPPQDTLQLQEEPGPSGTRPPGGFSGDGDELVGRPSGTRLAVSGPRCLAPLPIQKQVLVRERLLVFLSPAGTTGGDEVSGEGRAAPCYAHNPDLGIMQPGGHMALWLTLTGP